MATKVGVFGALIAIDDQGRRITSTKYYPSVKYGQARPRMQLIFYAADPNNPNVSLNLPIIAVTRVGFAKRFTPAAAGDIKTSPLSTEKYFKDTINFYPDDNVWATIIPPEYVNSLDCGDYSGAFTVTIQIPTGGRYEEPGNKTFQVENREANDYGYNLKYGTMRVNIECPPVPAPAPPPVLTPTPTPAPAPAPIPIVPPPIPDVPVNSLPPATPIEPAPPPTSCLEAQPVEPRYICNSRIAITGKQFKDTVASTLLPNNTFEKAILLGKTPRGSIITRINTQVNFVLDSEVFNKEIYLNFKNSSGYNDLVLYDVTAQTPIMNIEPNTNLAESDILLFLGIPSYSVFTLNTFIPDDALIVVNLEYALPIPTPVLGESLFENGSSISQTSFDVSKTNYIKNKNSFNWRSLILTGKDIKNRTALNGSNLSISKTVEVIKLPPNQYLTNISAYVTKKDATGFKVIGKLSEGIINPPTLSLLGNDTYNAYSGANSSFQSFSNLTGRDKLEFFYNINTSVETKFNRFALEVISDVGNGGTGAVNSISDDLELFILWSTANAEDL